MEESDEKSIVWHYALRIGCFATTLLVALQLVAQGDSTSQIPRSHVPAATSRTRIDLSAFARFGDLGAVANEFDRVLEANGYEGQGWSYLGLSQAEEYAHELERDQIRQISGFSVVTQVEQYDTTTGKWVQGSQRFQVRDTKDYSTFYDRMKLILFNAPIGHYRMFLFLVDIDNSNPARKEEPASYEDWNRYFHRTYKSPMLADLSKVNVHNRTLNGMCFVYEFERASADGQIKVLGRQTLPATNHLKGSGLFDGLHLK